MQALALESESSSKAAGVPGDFSMDGNQLNEILDELKQSDSALSSSRTLGLTKKLIDENLSEIPSCYGSSSTESCSISPYIFRTTLPATFCAAISAKTLYKQIPTECRETKERPTSIRVHIAKVSDLEVAHDFTPGGDVKSFDCVLASPTSCTLVKSNFCGDERRQTHSQNR
jgi:hypothetical protein